MRYRKAMCSFLILTERTPTMVMRVSDPEEWPFPYHQHPAVTTVCNASSIYGVV